MTTESAFFVEKYVHQLMKNDRWVVAQWDYNANEWKAPMTALERRVTGAHTYFARTLNGLGATSYKNKYSAIRRAVEVYGDSED